MVSDYLIRNLLLREYRDVAIGIIGVAPLGFRCLLGIMGLNSFLPSGIVSLRCRTVWPGVLALTSI